VAVEGVTVAVKVTDCPLRDGFRLEASVVLVGDIVAFTPWISAADVLLL